MLKLSKKDSNVAYAIVRTSPNEYATVSFRVHQHNKVISTRLGSSQLANTQNTFKMAKMTAKIKFSTFENPISLTFLPECLDDPATS